MITILLNDVSLLWDLLFTYILGDLFELEKVLLQNSQFSFFLENTDIGSTKVRFDVLLEIVLEYFVELVFKVGDLFVDEMGLGFPGLLGLEQLVILFGMFKDLIIMLE